MNAIHQEALDAHPLAREFESLVCESTNRPSPDILLERPFHAASEVKLADIHNAYLVLFPWGVNIDPTTGDEMVGGMETPTSIAIGNGNKKLEVVLGIYRVLALKALALNKKTGVNQKILIPSGDVFAIFKDPGDEADTEKLLKVSWSQSYADMIESLDLKLRIKRRPESTNTLGEMAILLDEMASFDRKNVVCITDWAQGVRQVTMLLLLLHNNQLKSPWIDKATKKSLDLIKTHPAWLFFANTDNIYSLYKYIDTIEPDPNQSLAFKKRLTLVHTVAKDPNRLFKNDPERLHQISHRYQENIHQRENIWGESALHDGVAAEKKRDPDWFSDVVTPELLAKLGSKDPRIKFISSPEILRRYDDQSYNQLRELMHTGAGQMTVAYNLLGTIEIFLGIYYSMDEEYNDLVRSAYIKNGDIPQ